MYLPTCYTQNNKFVQFLKWGGKYGNGIAVAMNIFSGIGKWIE